MANSILWYQPAKLSDEDLIFVNGKLLSEGPERTEAFDRMKKTADRALNKKRPWCGRVNSYYLIKGSFSEKDERGRLLSFTFVSNEENVEDALNQSLRAANKSLDATTLTCVKDYPSQQLKYKRKLAGIIALCILIAIIIAIISNLSTK